MVLEQPAGVRAARASDCAAVGRLLHDFNEEFSEPAPAPGWLSARVERLLAAGEARALLAGAGPDGVAVLRLRPSLWSEGLECYLAELYVVPERRGQGLGRALLEGAIALARAEGAVYIDLATSEQDVAARSLYESAGFSNREGGSDGPLNYYYGRDL
jgi:ribosomal protein S18 acetylase RimI-like enzyme